MTTAASSDGEPGRFLTVADVADTLALKVDDVLVLVTSGELPAIRLTTIGSWRIEHSVLESYIAAKYEESRILSLWEQSDLRTPGNPLDAPPGGVSRPPQR